MRRHRIKETILKMNILFAFLQCCNSLPVSNDKNVTMTEHLKSKVIQDICSKRDTICSSYTYKLCAVRQEKGYLMFREFSNDCHLFLINMCEYPGTEWAIVDQKPCIHSNPRRDLGNETLRDSSEPLAEAVEAVDNTGGSEGLSEEAQATTEETEIGPEAENEGTETVTEGSETESTRTAPALRAAKASTASTVHYEVDYAMDGHNCPQYCPPMYQPVCVNINRGYGKYFRLLHFSNHCEADKHYCINWETAYQPPAGMDEPLFARPSNAAWSFCASGSYMNFMTFAQTATSMAHYGWLAGPQRAQHIMEPFERGIGTG